MYSFRAKTQAERRVLRDSTSLYRGMEHYEISQHRLHTQRLAQKAATTEAALRWLGAVQAQDYSGAKWGLAQRVENATNQLIDDTFNDGRIVRTHAMRPTWHFVLPEDIRWLQRLTAPRVHTANTHAYKRNELDDSVLRRSQDICAAALQGGKQLTRNELGRVLAEHGIIATANRLAYITMYAELNAMLCSGALRGKQFTYALLEERVPPAPERHRDEALAELAKRYFQSHGPATAHDFAWWSGLTLKDSRIAIELIRDDLEYASVDGNDYWFLPPLSTPSFEHPVVHLLPNYDEHFVAYRDHAPSFDTRVVKPRGPYDDALPVHLITLNGHVIGGWRRKITRTHVTITTSSLIPVTKRLRTALEDAGHSYGRFLGLPSELS